MKNLEAYELLSLAIKVAICDKNTKAAFDLIDQAKAIAFAAHPPIHNFEWVAMAATQQVCMVMTANCGKKTPSTHTEYGFIQSWFKENYATIFPNSSLEKIKAGRYIPDFMLRLESGSVVPVECKKTFNARSLRQLQAYMDHFGSSSGIAVASKLSVSLPENVRFVLRPAE